MNLQRIIKPYDFTGHTAVITGGAGILGGEMACALVGCGANVAVLDLNPADVSLSDRLQEGPGQTMFIQTSVLDRDILTKAEEAVTTRFGSVDMLLNVAGGHHPHATTSPSLSFFDLPEGVADFVDREEAMLVLILSVNSIWKSCRISKEAISIM